MDRESAVGFVLERYGQAANSFWTFLANLLGITIGEQQPLLLSVVLFMIFVTAGAVIRDGYREIRAYQLAILLVIPSILVFFTTNFGQLWFSNPVLQIAMGVCLFFAIDGKIYSRVAASVVGLSYAFIQARTLNGSYWGFVGMTTNFSPSQFQLTYAVGIPFAIAMYYFPYMIARSYRITIAMALILLGWTVILLVGLGLSAGDIEN